MKVAILLTFAMASVAAAGKAAVVATSPAPALNPKQSNPPDPGDAYQPRSQSGCLSNIGIHQPTPGTYVNQGGMLQMVILADMFLPQSNTGAEIVDASNNNTVATLIPTLAALNFTTITTSVALPTAVTPGTYSVRFQQTYSNSFASGLRSQTFQAQLIVVSSGASTPAPPVTTSVNALGVTVTIPPTSGITPAPNASVPASGAPSASGPNATGAQPTGTAATTGSGATADIIDSFSIIIAVMLGFVGVLAAL